MSNYTSAILIVIGTFLPALGAMLVVLLALILDGRARWIVLAAGPAVVGAICWAIAGPVMYDGNMLAAIFYLLYFLALLVYYPALVLVAIVKRLRARSGRPD